MKILNYKQIKMSWFDDEKQNNFKADFGFAAPHRTLKKCANPVFSSPYYHRMAIMKHEHFGSKGDSDEGGVAGWVAKQICTGCGKEYRKNKRGFYIDKQIK